MEKNSDSDKVHEVDEVLIDDDDLYEDYFHGKPVKGSNCVTLSMRLGMMM